ncbi:lysosomal proton-coupled steroid conjugate and bile acid symporter SLC46A3-like [Argopecten irradians]|uniref:lysosomal proton-coupled steroid conjugate and bile acid symporter SLC46A3-like n=1 Tax=Argopecten irradians TaxID=31199 RepID=UPI0037111708
MKNNMEKGEDNHGTLRWSHGLIGVVLMFNLFAVLLSSLVTTQYVVVYLQKDMFPNSTSLTSNVTTCNLNKSTEEFKERTAVQQAASKLNIYLKLMENLPAIVTSGVIGGLSDRFGRTRVLTFTTSCFFLSTCVFSIIVYLEVDVYYFLISSVLYGTGGGLYGALSIGFAYVSDITSHGKQRTLMITILEASIGIGASLSGFVSGFIIEGVGFFYAGLCVCAASACSVLVAIFLLPNSRPSEVLLSKTSILENARAAFSFYIRASPMRHKYILLIIAFLVGSFSLLGKLSAEVLYELNVPFCWTSVKVGYYSAISISTSMIIGVALVKLLQMFFKEEIIGIFSCISAMTASIVEAFAYNDAMIFSVPVIGFLSTLIYPMTRSLLSKLTSADRQGALFAGVAVAEIVANLGSNVGASAIYSATVGSFRGSVFLVFASLSFLTMCILLMYRATKGNSKTIPIADVDIDMTQDYRRNSE